MAPEKTSFSLTCSLLSQYIKEKGSLTDLGFGVAGPGHVPDSASLGKSETYRPPTTMSLLPGVDVTGDYPADTEEETMARNAAESMKLFPQTVGFGRTLTPFEAMEPERAQLTIFYGGKILVFDDFPADKANDLMNLASKGKNFASGTPVFIPAASGAAPVSEHKAPPAPANFPSRFTANSQPNFSDLPIARKASLHRFLEKRKDRITSKAPYPVKPKDIVVKTEEEEICKPWLGWGRIARRAQAAPSDLWAL